MYLYAAASLTVQPRKSDKNVVGSGHVREYRSAFVVATVITLTSVVNFRNVTRAIKYATLVVRFRLGYFLFAASVYIYMYFSEGNS